MTFNPGEWVCIDCANQYGLDKETFERRLAFGKEIVQLVKDQEDLQPWIDNADEPEMFTKSLLTIKDMLEGKANGHLIGLDASNSGPALLSILGRCITGMNNTCLTLSDLYSKIQMQGYDRTQIKKATIPYVYGSIKISEKVFGEDATKFEDAYSKAVPTASALRDILLHAWDSSATSYTWFLPDGHTAHIKVKGVETLNMSFLGEEFKQQVTVNKSKKSGMSLPANATHSYDAFVIRELTTRCNHKGLDHKIAAIKHHLNHGSEHEPESSLEMFAEEFNFVSVYGFNHIKRNCLKGVNKKYLERLLDLGLELIKNPSFEIRTIHDEAACHPNHVSRMQQVYNQIMAESYASNWCCSVLKLLTGNDFSSLIPPVDPVIFKQLQTAKYAFH